MESLYFHFNHGSDNGLLFHCAHVTWIAEKILVQIIKSDPKLKIKAETIYLGAFLHDIGRTRVQNLQHGIVGAEMIRKSFSEDIARIAECHIGAGIPVKEAITLGLPAKDYIPITLEEKIVCYADKLVDYKFSKSEKGHFSIKNWFTYNSVENEKQKMGKKLGRSHPAIKRLEFLEKELWDINGGPFLIV